MSRELSYFTGGQYSIVAKSPYPLVILKSPYPLVILKETNCFCKYLVPQNIRTMLH